MDSFTSSGSLGSKECHRTTYLKSEYVNAQMDDGGTPLDQAADGKYPWDINRKHNEITGRPRKHDGKTGKELKAEGKLERVNNRACSN